MASAIKYLSNITKSIKYASIDAIKDLNPVITEGIETNSDILKTTYTTMKNFKAYSNKAYRAVQKSQIGELAADLKNNLFEDIKHGTFYNRERVSKVDQSLMDDWNNDSDFDFDVGDSEDYDKDFGMDDLADKMDSVGEKSTSAISQVIARGAEYQVHANKQSTMQLLASQNAMTSMLHSDISALNTNMANILKFNTENMSVHINNSAQFYARQQEQMSEITSILKDMHKTISDHYSPVKVSNSKKRLSISDVMDSSGNINISQYAKYIQQNINDNDTGMGDLLKTAMDMGIGKSIVASPLSGITKLAVQTLIPNILKDSMKDLNNTMSGLFSNLLLKITGTKSSPGLLGMIGDYLGISEKYKTGFDVSKYNKGATTWTGKDHKATTEVIPILLGKIYSAVSGEDELRYDYNSGRFIKAKSIIKKWKDQELRDARNASGDLYSDAIAAINQMKFENEEQRKQLQKDLDTIMKYNLKNMKVFNPNDKSIDAKTYGLKGGKKSEYNLELIREIIKKLPKSEQLQMMQAKNLFDVIDSRKRNLSQLEEDGDSIFNILEDGSFSNRKKKKNVKKSPINSSLVYLHNINKELAYIRELLSNNSFGRKRKSKNNILPSFDDYKFYGNKNKKVKLNKKEKKINNSYQDDNFEYGSDIDQYSNSSIDETKAKQTFLDKMIEAKTLNEKFKVIMGGISDLSKTPAKFLAGIISKADHRVYQMLFGSHKNDDGSVMNKISSSLKEWIDKTTEQTISKWDEFKNKISTKFSSENIKDVTSKIVEALGFDSEKMGKSAKEYFFGDEETSFFGGIKKIFKKGFTDIWGGIKNSFKSVRNWFKPAEDAIRGVKNASGISKEKRNESILSFNNRIKEFAGSIDNAASGKRRVTKTGLIAVSEGEMIIPPDQNPYNINKRKYNENLAIKKYNKYFGINDNINSYYDGGVVEEEITPLSIFRHKKDNDWFINNIPTNVDERKSLFNKLKSMPGGSQAIDLIKRKLKGIVNNKDKHFKRREKYNVHTDYNEGQEPLYYRIAQEAGDLKDNIIKSLQESPTIKSIQDKIKNNTNSDFKEATADVTKNLKDYLPDIAAGGITGAALSAVLGIVGGPLLGAAAGTAIGLIKNSEKVQKWLFGDLVTDENGNTSRTGGVLSKNISNNIQKYFPDMSKGAIVGGITSILPFVPGGPLVGILLGSAVGFAKNNEKVKNTLFGEDTVLSKATQKVKKMLPKMGLGAAIGLVTGPFGLATNLVVGSAIGFASDTNKFKDIVFGKEGFDGQRHGGITGAIRDHFDRANAFLKSITKDFVKDFIEPDIKQPLKDFFAPLKQQGNLILRWFKDAIREAFVDKVGKPIGSFFYKHLVSAEGRIGKMLFGKENEEGKRRGGIFGTAWRVATSPLRALGAAGRSIRRHQLKTGRADDLSADERIAERNRLFRNGTGQNRLTGAINRISNGRLFNTGRHASDNWYNADVRISQMDSDQSAELADRIDQVRFYKNKKKFHQQLLAQYAKRPLEQLDSMVKKGECSIESYRKIRKAISIGNVNTVRRLVSSLPITPDEAKKLAIQKLTKAATKMKEALENEESEDKLKEDMVKALQDAGFNDIDINDPRSIERLSRYLRRESENAEAETDQKNVDKMEEDKQIKSPLYQLQKQQHNELISKLDLIIKAINPNYEIPSSSNVSESVLHHEDIIEQENQEEEIQEQQQEENRNIQNGIANRLSNMNSHFENAFSQNGIFSKISSTMHNLATQGKNALMYTTDSLGRRLKMKFTRDGDTVVDQSNSENQEVLDQQQDERNTQKGIFSKISEMAGGFRKLFGGDEEENGSGKSKGILGTLASLGSGALRLLFTKPGAIIGGIAGLGLMGMKIKKKRKDVYGNQVYDENGNPVYDETTLGSVIASGVKRVWMGEDGTGNTSGIWYHIKDFTVNHLWPAICNGAELLFQKIPDAVEYLISKLPSLIWEGIKAIKDGIKSWWSDPKDKKSKSAKVENINKSTGAISTTYNGGNIFGNSSNNNTSTNNTISIIQGNNNQSGSIPNTNNISINPPKLNSSKNTYQHTALNTNSNSQYNKKSSSFSNTSAYMKTNENASNKAQKELDGMLDQPTVYGVTLRDILNDDTTVLAEFTDQETGQLIQVTGSNIIQLSSYYPGLSQQILGVDLTLTEKERDKYTESLGLRIDKSAGARTKHAMFNILARGGSAELKALKYYDKALSVPSKIMRRIPIVGGTASRYFDITRRLPVKIASTFNDFVYNSRVLGSIKDGAHMTWLDHKPISKKAKKAAMKEAKAAKKANSLTGKIKNWGYNKAKNTTVGSKIIDKIDDARLRLWQLQDNAKAFKGNTLNKIKNSNIYKSAIDKIDDARLYAWDKTDKISAKLTSMTDDIVTKAKSTKAAQKISESATKVKTSISQSAAKINTKLTDSKVGNTVTKATEGMKGFMKDNKVIGKLKSALSKMDIPLKDLGKNAIPDALMKASEKIGQKFAGKLGQASAKMLVRAAEAVTPAILILIAEAIVYFTKGMYDADMILKIKKPNALMRVLAGIVKALNEVFLLGLIDTGVIFDIIWSCLKAIFPSLENSNFEKKRKELQQEVEEYNRKNGTSLTEEEYLRKDKILYKIWDSRAFSPVRGLLEGTNDILGGAVNGVVDLGKGIIGGWTSAGKGVIKGAKNLINGHPIEAVKDVAGGFFNGVKSTGKGLWNGVKSVGKGLIKAPKSIVKGIGNFFGIGGKKKKKKNKNIEENSIISEGTNSTAVQQIQDLQDSQITDENGNIIGSGVDENGYIQSMYIPQGDQLSSLDQGQMISDSNMKLMQQTSQEINSSIPLMITTFKQKLATMFGFSNIKNNGNLLSIIKESRRNMLINNPSISFLDRLKMMWSKVNNNTKDVIESLPNEAKNVADQSKDATISSIGLANSTNNSTKLLGELGNSILKNPLISSQLFMGKGIFNGLKNLFTGHPIQALKASGGGLFDSIGNLAKGIPNNLTKGIGGGKNIIKGYSNIGSGAFKGLGNLFTGHPINALKNVGNGVLSGSKKVGAGLLNLFGFGKGSGISNQQQKDQSHVLENTDPAVESFISQKYSRFASSKFKTSGDVTGTTVADAGCAPAAAVMTINSNPLSKSQLNMRDAIKHALNYKQIGGGVSAEYFVNEFKNHGFNSAFVTKGNASKDQIILRSLKAGNSVVLMGIDRNNTSKSKSPFGPTSHYVVATGLSEDGQYIYINDPEAKTPKIAYPTKLILNSTELGIIPTSNSLKKITSSMMKRIRRALKNYTGGAVGKMIYVGDSRIEGMKNSIGESDTIKFISKSTAGIKWLKSVAENQILSILKNEPNTVIVFNIGINDLSNIDDYIKYYNDFKSKANTENIWYMSINPVSGKASVTNESIIEFNSKIQGFAQTKYLDSYNYLQENGFNMIDDSNYDSETYTKIHEYVINTIGGTVTSNNNQESQDNSFLNGNAKISSLTDIYSAFDELAKYYGLSSSNDSGALITPDYRNTEKLNEKQANLQGISGNVSSNKIIADTQRALVAKMKSVEGSLKYQQGNSQFPGSRNPDEGGGDCSSTIQWAYKNVTGKDVGNWTGAMRNSSSTYTVTTSTSDESKLQLGDIILKDGHVEMYAGNGEMIGHGGGNDGKTLGPTTKKLGGSPPYNLVRRLNDFKGSGSGVSSFVSQLDPKYSNKSIGDEKVQDAGCAPAVATMASNMMKLPNQKSLTMENAISIATPYKINNSGVSADYFIEQFNSRGLSSMVFSGNNKNKNITNVLKGKTGAVVLLGSDPNNKSKSKSPFGPNNHYVLATGMSKDGKIIYINDPESKKEGIPYLVENILPYTSLGIMPVQKGLNNKLDNISQKLKKILSKYSGKSVESMNVVSKLDSIEGKVWAAMRYAGYSEIATASAMGNIYGESGFDPAAIEKGTGAGFGLIQWTGGRRTAIENYAAKRGKSPSDLSIQIEFFLKECDKNQSEVTYQWQKSNANYYGVGPYDYDDWKNAKDIATGTMAFMVAFERPAASAAKSSIEKRTNAAIKYYEQFTGTTITEDIIGQLNFDFSNSNINNVDSNSAETNTNNEDISAIKSLTQAYEVFDKLAAAYGIGSVGSSDNSSTTNINSEENNNIVAGSATSYLEQFKKWEGAVTGDDKHKDLIDTYNKYMDKSQYKMTYKDGWCQAAVSAAAGPTNNSSIVANTASPPYGVQWYKNQNSWHDKGEAGFKPNPGDTVYYDWDGDQIADHTGAVYTTENGKFTSIEGNTGNGNGECKINDSISNTWDKILGFGRPKWSGSGSGILNKINRFKNNPKPIGEFKDIVGRGTNNEISIPDYSKDNIVSKSKQIKTPDMNKISRESKSNRNSVQSINQNKNSNNNNIELIDIIIKLLSQVVDNTSSIKEIALLLTKIINNDTTTPSNNKSSDGSVVTKAMILKSLSESANNTQNSTLESLIRSVEAIAAQ